MHCSVWIGHVYADTHQARHATQVLMLQHPSTFAHVRARTHMATDTDMHACTHAHKVCAHLALPAFEQLPHAQILSSALASCTLAQSQIHSTLVYEVLAELCIACLICMHLHVHNVQLMPDHPELFHAKTAST